MSDRTHARRANVFRGTMRDPEAAVSLDAAEVEALSVVKTNIEAQALSQGRTLNSVQLDRALSVAQRLIRRLPRDQLQSIASNSGLLKTITDQSLAVAPIVKSQTTASKRPDDHPALGARDTLDALLARRGGDAGERSPSSARYDGMDDARMTKTMDDARAEAMRLGMSWAINNRELLKLGAGAIQSLHEAGVRRDTFERMTSERVGIRAQTAVNFAGWAVRHKLTPTQTNDLMNSTSDLHESLTKDLAGEERRRAQRELDQALNKYLTGPNTPEARRELEEQRMRHAKTPAQQEQVRAESKKLEAAAQQVNAKEAKAEVKDTKNDDLLAAINEPTPPKTEAPKADAKTTPAKAPAAAAPKGPKQ